MKIQDLLVGKRVICPKCKGVFRIGDTAEPDAGPERTPSSPSYYETAEPAS